MKKATVLHIVRWAALFAIASVSFGTVLAFAEPTHQNFIADEITDITSIKQNNYTQAKTIGCNVPAEIPEELTNLFAQATKDIPCHLLQSLQRVEVFVDNSHKFPRAMANARIIKVRKDAINDPEMVNVLIHELGHVVDLGGLQSTTHEDLSEFKDGPLTFYQDDLSLKFYSISWTPKGKQSDTSRLDFAGEYAAYDMFEDFAEAFLLYIEHGRYFKALALQNDEMKKKYLFFKKYVFNGKEFETGEIPENLLVREWDITKV